MARIRMIAKQQLADIPERTQSFWKLAGPGAVLVGLSIGAGEIVIWPRIVAEYGASMAWAAVLGIFLQLWVNLEVGRWTIATGETTFMGFSRLWLGFGPLFLILTVLASAAPGWARASGLSLKALLVGPAGFGSDTFWTIVTFSIAAIILFGPKVIYQSVERSVEALIAIVTVGLIAVVLAVGSLDVWSNLGKGILNVGYRDPDINIRTLFGAFVFAGAGGIYNLFYGFYLRDKNIGMGARIPKMTNPIRGVPESIPSVGFQFDETPKNRKRFAEWWDYVKKDQILFFWLLNTFTLILFMFGALAVLHPKGIVPAAGTLIWDEAVVLGEVWGDPGRVLFLIVGFATLFGTQLVILDGVSRTLADIIYTNIERARSRQVGWWYMIFCGGWMILGCIITFIMERIGVSDLGFIFNSAYIGGFAMAIYVPLLLYLNKRHLPTSARPGISATAMMILASLVYAGFAVSSILWEVTSRL